MDGACRRERQCSIAAIPQLVNANEIAAEPLLPSFLYIPGERDFPPGVDRAAVG